MKICASRTKSGIGVLLATVVVAAVTALTTTTVSARTQGTPAAAPAPVPLPEGIPVLRPTVVQEIPHDREAFTQGFELADGILYEGTGLPGQSQLRELDPETGQVLRAAPLPGQLFGEGITVVDDTIWQLTFTDGVVLRWDRASLTLQEQLPLAGEGWGLCYDGDRLIRSDGTDLLRFYDPDTFAPAGEVTVTLHGKPVSLLNELECVDGQFYANVWQSDQIYRINPDTGRVTTIIDATGLLDTTGFDRDDVLNGIAALPDDEFLITGKRWPTTFRVTFTP